MTDIVFLSLLVAFSAMVVVLPLAVALARWLSAASFWPRAVTSAVAQLPLVLPPVVTGYFLLLVFGREGVIGQWLDALGLRLAFTWQGAALAAGIMAFPLVLRPILVAMEQQDERLGEMAATLGAGRWRRFVTITLPLAFPGIVAGAVLGFAKALGEFGATITFVANIPGETRTLSLAIYTALQSPSGDGLALGLIAFSLAISLVAVFGSEILISLLRRRERDER